MSIRGFLKNLIRKMSEVRDVDMIQNVIYNDSAGAQKGFDVEPVIVRSVAANEAVPMGSYIRISAATYDITCVGKEHETTRAYRRGDIVTSGGNVFICKLDHSAQAFDSSPETSPWTLVAPQTIAGIPAEGVSNVCVGKFHNAVSVPGFLVHDESTISRVE